MAKDKKKGDKKGGSDQPKAAREPGKRGASGAEGVAGRDGSGAHSSGGGHHAAKAHGQATQVDASLPGTRPELMELHTAARARRNAAALDSPAFRAAVTDLERIEVRIAAIDRAADPPLG